MIFHRGLPKRALIILPALLFCLGAAEFPPFHMKEFDEKTNQQTFSEPVPEVEVPKVSKRVYGTAEQKRLPVKGVSIEGVVPYPDRDITQKKIQAIIDKRFTQEEAIDLDDNGFTKRDLNQIGGFLREMLDRGGWDSDDLNNLVKLIHKQQFERGWITVEQLDNIAQSVTDYYREHGFILATAFVPEQEVKDGIIHLKVLEGRLGNVTVSNNDIFSQRTIAASFDHEIGKPVTEERIESALRRINDLPGVRVRGSFSPGHNVGETTLNIGVLDEQAWTSSVLLDNHGSPTTGVTRLFATAQWLNLRNKGQTLSIGALRSEGSGSTYGLIEYGLPVTDDERGRVKGTISTNQFAITTRIANKDRAIVGETDNIGATGTYQFIRSRTLNLSAEGSVTRKNVLFNVEDIPSLSSYQQILVGGVGVDYNQLWDGPQLLFSGHFGVDQGNLMKGAAGGQSTDFTKLLFTANLLKRFSIHNWLTQSHTQDQKEEQSSFNFVIKLNGQYTDKFLPSVEQFSLGGPNAVRAFSVSDVSVDSGAYVGFELFFDSPFDVVKALKLPIDPLRPFVFFDYAYGVAKDAAGDINQDAVLKAYGFGLRLNWAGHGAANLIFAKP
ncbi:MAG TPA: ShlB/FhaC/HecB family hemolysin secretion/activation protein, partial [Pseudomonadales bacterium]|nr:ShlB/FhaC/HecB family hemolysin secretion/activation protein [Pseudomonadales bacterium]